MKNEEKKAIKADSGKPILTTWPHAFLELGKTSVNGRQKYGNEMNYMFGDTLGPMRCVDAGIRHFLEYACGNDCAEDSNIHHLAHAAANALMALEIALTRPDADNRFYKKDKEDA